MSDRQRVLNSSATVKDFLVKKGATMVGIAPALAFKDAPDGHRATDIITNAKSVVVFGIKLVSGVVNWPQLVWDDSHTTRKICWQVYDHCGFEGVNKRLEHIAMDLAIEFELEGSHAVFFPGTYSMSLTEFYHLRLLGEGALECPQPLDPEKLAGLKSNLESPQALFSYRHAAVMAGLATFGANNLALHPVFGPRIRFSVVITDAKVDRYDKPLKESVCLYDKGCRACIETCPYGVFKELRRFEFAGLSHPWLEMYHGRCQFNNLLCGGTCIQTCPAGTGDKVMKKLVAKRFSKSKGEKWETRVDRGQYKT